MMLPKVDHHLRSANTVRCSIHPHRVPHHTSPRTNTRSLRTASDTRCTEDHPATPMPHTHNWGLYLRLCELLPALHARYQTPPRMHTVGYYTLDFANCLSTHARYQTPPRMHTVRGLYLRLCELLKHFTQDIRHHLAATVGDCTLDFANCSSPSRKISYTTAHAHRWGLYLRLCELLKHFTQDIRHHLVCTPLGIVP